MKRTIYLRGDKLLNEFSTTKPHFFTKWEIDVNPHGFIESVKVMAVNVIPTLRQRVATDKVLRDLRTII